MKWFSILKMNFIADFYKSDSLENANYISLQKGKKLFGMNRFTEALYYLDQAANIGFDAAVYKLRAKCFQKLNHHSQAVDDFDKIIEENPLDFSNYYSRAVSKSALSDVSGQLEDFQNCIYYCKKNSIAEKITLKKIEADLIATRNHLEGQKSEKTFVRNMPHVAAKNIINECLTQIRKIKMRSRKSTMLHHTELSPPLQN